MGMNVEFRIPCKSLLASLLVVILVSSLFTCLLVNSSNGASLTDVVHVKNEAELKEAIKNVSTKKATTITIDNDITLTESLVISADNNITLTSNKASGYYKLTGSTGKSTITVEKGALKLDSIIITHTSTAGELGGGVYVGVSGKLILYSGEISSNTAIDDGAPYQPEAAGGGVYNLGVFEMYGGKISNNRASGLGARMGGYGGGVYNIGTFTMFGGEISGNTAHVSGGGVENRGVFTMSGGSITSNTAGYGGGGVSNSGTFERQGGTISGNDADDIYPSGSDAGSSGSNGGTNNGNDGSTNGNGTIDGSDGINNGDNELSGEGFSLRAVVVICVCIVVVMGIIMGVLFVYFQKRINQVAEKVNYSPSEQTVSKVTQKTSLSVTKNSILQRLKHKT